MIFIDTSPRTLRTALSKFTERIRVILHGVSTYGDLLAKLKAVCMLSCEDSVNTKLIWEKCIHTSMTKHQYRILEQCNEYFFH